MQKYVSHEPLSLFDVEALLYVQEAQLDKFRKELTISTILENLARASSQTGGVREASA